MPAGDLNSKIQRIFASSKGFYAVTESHLREQGHVLYFCKCDFDFWVFEGFNNQGKISILYKITIKCGSVVWFCSVERKQKKELLL